MKFRPCIDIHKGKVKQIVGSTLSNTSKGLVENFVSEKSAAFFARMYKEDNLSGGHIIMLDKEGATASQAKSALQEYPFDMQIGGGINVENAESWLSAGASHVIVTSYAFKDGKINFENIEKLVKAIGKEKLVLDLSCRQRNGSYFVVTDRWQKFTDYGVNLKNLEKLSEYCDEFLIHAADVEGKCSGIQKGLIEILGNFANDSISSYPITYAGGIHSFSDLTLIHKIGKGNLDFTVGSALNIFGGKMSYKKLAKMKFYRSPEEALLHSIYD